jgi:hypothetical protein
MRSRTLNAVLLAVAVVMEAVVLSFSPSPWVGLIFGLGLLGLIIYLASFLELAGMFGGPPPVEPTRRRFRELRTSTMALLAEVSRLNWLVVDLERGFGSEETAQADIELSEQHLQDLLQEILQNAGKVDPGMDESSDTSPGAPGHERRRGERRLGERRQGTGADQDPPTPSTLGPPRSKWKAAHLREGH